MRGRMLRGSIVGYMEFGCSSPDRRQRMQSLAGEST